MALIIRRGTAADAEAIGRICYEAFRSIAQAHNFPPDLPDAEVTAAFLKSLILQEGVFDLVAEVDGRIAGSNFLIERDPIAGIGPVTVDPAIQNGAVGRALMQTALDHARQREAPGVRLVQAGYHSRSLALYLKLGFEARAQLACLQGPAIGEAVPDCAVRPAEEADLPACEALCLRVHGHLRSGELADATEHGVARVVVRAGRITGYASMIGYFGHAVGETTDDLKALIAAAASIAGPGVLVPTANGDLMRWCLHKGLRITQTMTLMSLGLYSDPKGAWLPSILY